VVRRGQLLRLRREGLLVLVVLWLQPGLWGLQAQQCPGCSIR
jgi:hypothetical protein